MRGQRRPAALRADTRRRSRDRGAPSRGRSRPRSVHRPACPSAASACRSRSGDRRRPPRSRRRRARPRALLGRARGPRGARRRVSGAPRTRGRTLAHRPPTEEVGERGKSPRPPATTYLLRPWPWPLPPGFPPPLPLPIPGLSPLPLPGLVLPFGVAVGFPLALVFPFALGVCSCFDLVLPFALPPLFECSDLALAPLSFKVPCGLPFTRGCSA